LQAQDSPERAYVGHHHTHVVELIGIVFHQMFDYVFQQATATTNKPLMQSRSKWVKVHSSTSHVHGLVEALRGPEVKGLLEGTKFAKEGVMLEK